MDRMNLAPPRFRHGQYVEIVGPGLALGSTFDGKRMVLAGQVTYIRNDWCWPIPDAWARACGVPEGMVGVSEGRLRLVSDDGLAPVRWADCAWRPSIRGVFDAEVEIKARALRRVYRDSGIGYYDADGKPPA